MSPERADEVCRAEARDAAGPRGEFGIGINSDGEIRNRIEIGISSNALFGKDPEQVYNECYRRRTGQSPTEPVVL